VEVGREPFSAEVVCRQHHHVFQVQLEEPTLISCLGKRPPCESEDPGTSQGQSSTIGQAGGRACRGSCGSVRTTSAACFRWGPESRDMCSGGQRTETHLSRTRGWGGGNVFDICRSRRGRATCACVRQVGARALSKMSHRKLAPAPQGAQPEPFAPPTLPEGALATGTRPGLCSSAQARVRVRRGTCRAWAMSLQLGPSARSSATAWRSTSRLVLPSALPLRGLPVASPGPGRHGPGRGSTSARTRPSWR